ncbi:MAG: HAD-IA family hydrolase [Planctomycetota bacterium]
MKALLIGSMGVVADTSERQREAYNSVFNERGVPLHWSQSEYQNLLRTSGGQLRIEKAIRGLDDVPDARELHRAKAERFQADVRKNGVICRPGIVETIRDVKQLCGVVGFVTTTDAANLEAILSAAPDLSADDFECILDQQDVAERKPDPEVYRLAMDKLGVAAADCIAVEDNTDGLASAAAAGIRCYAFPGENNAGHDFDAAEAVLQELSLSAIGWESAAPCGNGA